MSIALNPEIEQRIQRQVARGAFAAPAELISHALDLVEAEEDWLLRNKEDIHAGLSQSFAEAARGEGYSLHEIEAIVAERRASRSA
jgi:Arc/MetJ-type ribon-helix-helix transcriptional regulator